MKLLQWLTLFCLMTVSGLAGAHAGQSASFTAKPITESLVLLQGKGGNILLSKGEDGILIIDDDYADMAGALEKAIEKQGGVEQLRYVLNTHWHGDHTGTNAVWGKSAAIVAHDNVRKRLSSRQEIAFFDMVSEPYPEHALPTLTFPESMRIHFNGDELTLKHYSNGHTDSDSVVFFKRANVVHMGDHMFNPMFPFVDTASGGNVISYADNVAQILKRIDDETRVIPGHGTMTDKQGLQRYHAMLTGTIEAVTTMRENGLTLQEAQEQGLSDQWQSWGEGLISEQAWIKFIYDSL